MGIAKSLRDIRRQATEVHEFFVIYVVDEDDMLKGNISIKRLLVSGPSSRLKNIMNTDIVSVRTDTPSEEVAMIMKKYDLVSLPVVDAIGRLMGRITMMMLLM